MLRLVPSSHRQHPRASFWVASHKLSFPILRRTFASRLYSTRLPTSIVWTKQPMEVGLQPYAARSPSAVSAASAGSAVGADSGVKSELLFSIFAVRNLNVLLRGGGGSSRGRSTGHQFDPAAGNSDAHLARYIEPLLSFAAQQHRVRLYGYLSRLRARLRWLQSDFAFALVGL
jgi:hypothetical protein